MFTSDNLRTLFQHRFNQASWLNCLQRLFCADELRATPDPVYFQQDEGFYWGAINTTDHFRIGLFYYQIHHGSVVRRRVGLRNLVSTFTNPRWGEFDAALVVFDSGDHWRLSFVCDIKGEATAAKRYTYVFGSSELLYKTPIARFLYLQEKGISFEHIKAAFSVEALSDEFFNRYREQYADFVAYVTGKRYVKSGNKWEEHTVRCANPVLMTAFGYDEKRVRDYVKKMMGRLTFLHFLQRKGWLCGDLNYMQHLFERSCDQSNYLEAVLEPLFFGILNTKPAEREALFREKHWDLKLLAEWKEIPYLNGGLFECDEEDSAECRFPATYFRNLFQFFSEYNFTIDENDPSDAEIGVDPEMLGKIFENLLEDNKDKGAFYTPKEIVRYMCRESLIAYLVTQSLERGNSNPREKVESAIRDLLNTPEEIVPRMNERQKREFGESLCRIKICDPAIGSGAFPMGLLNELVRLRASIDAWAKDEKGNLLPDDYAALKSEIICNNIYGVDIEHGAIDIARLRFWLSIVVDEKVPHTLPNLDYKFMQGNSLITTFHGEYINLNTKEQKHVNVLEMQSEKKRLHQLKQQYYTATGEQKHKLNIAIKDSILRLIALQLDFEYRQWYNQHITTGYLPGMGISKQLSFADIKQELPAEKQRLCDIGSSLRKQLHNETKPLSERAKIDIHFFDWRMMFTEVFEGANPGFDIVIGNPPYIKEYANRKAFDGFRENSPYYIGKMDIWYGFTCHGIDLLSSNGILCFIAQNNWITSAGAKLMRNKVVNDCKICQILDFNTYMVFESADIQTMIMLFEKNSTTDFYSVDYRMLQEGATQQDMFALMNKQQRQTIYRSPIFNRSKYLNKLLTFSHYEDIFDKISNGKVYLQDKEIAQGIVFPQDFLNKKSAETMGHGYLAGDCVFGLTTKKIEELRLSLDELSLIKPYYTSEQISRYYVNKVNTKWMIYTDSSFADESRMYPYPHLKQHLDIFQPIITSSFKPYGLHRARNEYFFIGEKIISQRKCVRKPVFAYCDFDSYVTQTYFVIKTSRWNMKFLTGILNSILVTFWLKNKGKMQGSNYQVDKEPLRGIPIPKTTVEQQQPIINLVGDIIATKQLAPNTDTTDLEHEIDQLVYQLYGLTEKEIAIIEESCKQK